jgi:hypothetical protein
MSTHNIETFLGEIHKLYNVGIKYNEVMQKAMLATDSYVTVDIPSVDGVGVQTITVPSFAYIQNQLNAINQNVNAMSTLQDGSSYATLVDSVNGSVRQLFELSHNKTPFIGTQQVELANDNAFIDVTNDVINKLYSPNIAIAIDITKLTKSYSRQVEITKLHLANYETYLLHKTAVGNLKTFEEITAYYNSNSVPFTTTSSIFDVNFYKSRYNGNFSILNAVKNDDGTFLATFDTIKYNDSNNIVKNSKELIIGSKLSLLNENTLYNVLSVNASTNSVLLQRLYGFDELLVGVSNLTYVDDSTKRTVNIPLRFNEHAVMFVAATHILHGTLSGLSLPYLYSSRDITINIGGEFVNVDTYIKSVNGSDVAEYLKSLITQTAIPIKYAISPDKPAIAVQMFKVAQINKHIVDGSDIEYIKKLYSSQNKLSADLKASNSEISKYRSTLEQANYKNESDRKQVNQQLANEQNKYKALQSEFSSIVTELSNKDIGLYASTYAPKYRVRGFWPVQNDMESEYTRPQTILAYRVQYRYVSANNKIANSDNYSVKQFINDEEVETTGSFSVWQEFITPLKRRVIKEDGTVDYIVNNISDADQININQLDIAIQNNEQIDIRIKAISEVGYPNVLIESIWSDVVRVNFPPEFSTDIDFAKLQDDVVTAKQQIDLFNLIDNEGLIKHVKNAVNEQHTYFAHPATEVDSGFYTPELNRISLFDKLTAMQQDIIRLTNVIVNNASTLNATVVDSFNNEYSITNNATIKVFAGFYTDFATVAPKGDIVSHQLYIKLSNNVSTQVYSLSPGDNTIDTALSNYTKAPVGFVQDDIAQLSDSVKQTNGQIAYLRNRNVINNDDLYIENDALITPHAITIPSVAINTSATDSAKNVLHLNGSNIDRVALNDVNNVNFIAITSDYPGYDSAQPNTAIKEYLQKLSTKLTLPTTHKQLEAVTNDTTKACYELNDKFLVGGLTTGSYLLFNSINQSQLKVSSNAIDAFKELKQNTDILLPILFQYRMTDALGRINGIPGNTNTNLEYTKRIGIDMLLNGVLTQFDIEVTAKYSPNSLSTNNIPKISTVANTNNAPTIV